MHAIIIIIIIIVVKKQNKASIQFSGSLSSVSLPVGLYVICCKWMMFSSVHASQQSAKTSKGT